MPKLMVEPVELTSMVTGAPNGHRRYSLPAYAGMLLICHKKLFSDSLKDELRLLAMGVIGGAVYKEEKSSRRRERVI